MAAMLSLDSAGVRQHKEGMATTDPATASTLPPRDLPHQCPRCGAVLTPEEWDALTWRPWPDLGVDVAEHACGTTLARPIVDVTAEHRRDEGDDAMGEERAARDAAWRGSR